MFEATVVTVDTPRRRASAIQFFAPVLEVLESTFRILEARVTPPQPTKWLDGFVFRYADQTIHQAVLQKLARTISGLHAIETLLAKGLHQEQGMIQRALDEIGEDIVFLSLAVIHGEVTPLHRQYLEYFYAEEFLDPSNLMASHTSRGMVKREKIRAYNNRQHGNDASRANIAGKVLTKAYSGFVHAASPHIMDMYVGKPYARFDTTGELRHQFKAGEQARDALNYFYRAMCSMALAAKAFDDDELFSAIKSKISELDTNMKTLRD